MYAYIHGHTTCMYVCICLYKHAQDFDSPALKNKKHWNSFTTSFFIDTSQVESALREEGHLALDRQTLEGYLKGPLRCHGCHAGQTNMPTLKSHLTHCRRIKEEYQNTTSKR